VNVSGFFVQASATALPARQETFDAIVMLGTLPHLYDPSATLRQILTLLKPGRTYRVKVTAAHTTRSRAHTMNNCYSKRYSQRSTKAARSLI
jgi:ubiquinone/menaquinone biosynthesis C-methylase UbiE